MSIKKEFILGGKEAKELLLEKSTNICEVCWVHGCQLYCLPWQQLAVSILPAHKEITFCLPLTSDGGPLLNLDEVSNEIWQLTDRFKFSQGTGSLRTWGKKWIHCQAKQIFSDPYHSTFSLMHNHVLFYLQGEHWPLLNWYPQWPRTMISEDMSYPSNWSPQVCQLMGIIKNDLWSKSVTPNDICEKHYN